MAGAGAVGAVTVESLSVAINEMQAKIAEASGVVTGLRAEFQSLIDGVNAQIIYQGQESGKDNQVLQNKYETLRVAVEAITQSYDQNTLSEIRTLYIEATEQHAKTVAIQQEAAAIYTLIQGLPTGCHNMNTRCWRPRRRL